MQPQPRTISLSSGDLRYYVAGDGRPLVYLHPAGGVHWTRVLDELSKSFTLHVPVVPGFDGTAPHRAVKSMPALAALMGEFIDRVVGRACDLMGCSFGGYLALWLAAERPGLLDHLVIECPAGLRSPGAGERPADVEALHKVLYLYPDKRTHAAKPPEVLAANRRMMAAYGAAADTDAELLARLPGIDKLTLILHGTGDRLVPKESVQLLKSRLPKAYLVYVWDAAHAIEVDQPERMLSVLGSFLERSEGFIVNWGSLALDAPQDTGGGSE